MDDRLDKKIDRVELANYFESLVQQIRKGTFLSGRSTWTIPDEINAKIRFREKRGRFEAKMKLRWSTLEDYDSRSRKEVDHWKDSLRSVKKQMGAAYKRVALAAKNNAFPESTDLEELVRSSQAFASLADPDLEEALKEYLDHLENLKDAVAARQLNVLQHEVRDIGNRMRNCHREFK